MSGGSLPPFLCFGCSFCQAAVPFATCNRNLCPRASRSDYGALNGNSSMTLSCWWVSSFSVAAQMTFWAEKSFAVEGSRVRGRTFSSITDPYPLDSSSRLYLKLWQLRMSPDVTRCLPGGSTFQLKTARVKLQGQTF